MTFRYTIAIGLALMLCACAPRRLDVRVVSYAIDAHVDPATHRLDATAAVDLAHVVGGKGAARGTIDLRLHPDLEVDEIQVDGATLRSHRQRLAPTEEDGEVQPTTHSLTLAQVAGDVRVTLRYGGSLFQDVAAGEAAGQVHNFAVSAHVGEDGIYLEPAGYWYPRPLTSADAPPAQGLSDYRLAVDPVDGFELVAGLESRSSTADGRLRWESPFPLDGLVLLGGPLERFSRTHRGIALHAVLAPGKAEVAEDILDASAEYLDRYEPLVGPYPFGEFTVLEAFFSSGFAFPTCTQIAGSQLSAFKQYRRHGYLDHELLHNWWGNGLLVDPRDGNWCEGLASYMGNYYGLVLDGDDEGARKLRRNQSNFLSSIDPAEDRPLGTFGLAGGAGRGIGYSKGSAVFHMLERRIGAAALSAGLRALTAERMGRHVSWTDLQDAFERASREDLDGFFDQWVRKGGAPQLELVSADWAPGSGRVRVTLRQSGTDFDLDVPLRLFYTDTHEDVTVRVTGPETIVDLPVARELHAVELDPDYHVFRRMKTAETMPTSAFTRRATRLVAIVPPGELAEGYGVLRDAYESAVLGDEADRDPAASFDVRTDVEVGPADLTAGGVLVLGEAVRAPAVAAFLERAGVPVTFDAGGFALEGVRYDDPLQAVYLTVHHPDLPGQGVTVYFGNSPEALANARVLSFYPNSLLVFETPASAADSAGAPAGMPRTEVVRRMDFESHERIEF